MQPFIVRYTSIDPFTGSPISILHWIRDIHILYSCYARAIKQSSLSFDVIFGPAYKGIPLVTCVSVAWHQLFGEDKDICYNRKEAKDHGEVLVLLLVSCM